MAEGSFFIVGGAGFIGSHFCDHLLGLPGVNQVTIYDNMSSGRRFHFAHHLEDERFRFINSDVKNIAALTEAMAGHQVVIHLASNPDIAKAITEPDIDFREGTFLTNNVVEAMRLTGTKKILYASGSGVYGDIGAIEADENYSPMIVTSTYGASKLAGEALIAAYCHMFDMQGIAFRFGNVVGPRQTHGVGFDFTRRLLENPDVLTILGDGRQSKSYIHVENIVSAVLLASEKLASKFEAFNVATGDYITVTEIADIAASCVGAKNITYEYTGGDRGWKGDVPIVRLNIDKIKKLGWRCSRNCHQAITDSINSMLADMKKGLI